ncbi:MAG: S-layer homology domain-containing protein [Clostridia bacterium]|nr:S-layer homology domain-containing protein [Clostridia bacterium]
MKNFFGRIKKYVPIIVFIFVMLSGTVSYTMSNNALEKPEKLCPGNCVGKGKCDLYTDKNSDKICDISQLQFASPLPTPILEKPEKPCPGNCVVKGKCDLYTDKNSDKICDISELQFSDCPFKDAQNHWAKKNIIELKEKGVIDGYPDGTINPDGAITRQEVVVLLVKAIGLKPSDSPAVNFLDSDKIASWAKEYIGIAVEKKIVSGYKDGNFNPTAKVTRQEIVVMLMRAMNISESSEALPDFKDRESISSWARGFVSKACALSVVKGYPDNTFGYSNPVKRGEAFTMLCNTLNLKLTQ